MTREVAITGLGLVSAQGEGLAPHLEAIDARRPAPVATQLVEPYQVHPVVKLEWDRQIPKKSDQRQMEPWQKLGCYAAGLALDDCGAKDDAALKSRMQLIVAAGGGERDYAVDGQILTGLKSAEDPGVYLNEHLMGDLRPTLFLAQLSNLLAGNISIVHGVTGASRTFMGEEQCGVDAIRIARERIAAGQADIVLVGGSYNAERPDVLLIYEMGGYLWKKPLKSVFDRAAEGGGFVPASGAAFLVLEAREHARARGAKEIALVTSAVADRTRRAPGDVAASLTRLWAKSGASASPLVVSGATGALGPTEEEREALNRLAPGMNVLATGDLIGQTVEAQAPAGVAIAAALLHRGDAAEAVVTSVGHWRGEGLVRLAKAG